MLPKVSLALCLSFVFRIVLPSAEWDSRIFSSNLQEDAPFTAEIIYPREGDAISGTVEILGTIEAPNLLRYTADFGYPSSLEQDWFIICDDTKSVRNDLVCRWNTAGITPGDYQLRLTAYLSDGSKHSSTPIKISIQKVETQPTTSVLLSGNTSGIGAPADFPGPTVTARASEPISDSRSQSDPPLIFFLFGGAISIIGFAVWRIRDWGHAWQRSRFRKKSRKKD